MNGPQTQQRKATVACVRRGEKSLTHELAAVGRRHSRHCGFCQNVVLTCRYLG